MKKIALLVMSFAFLVVSCSDDDDNPIAVVVSSVTDAIAEEGTDLEHTITLSGASSEEESYGFSITDVTTTDIDYTESPAFSEGVIYDATAGEIAVPANVTSFTVTISSLDDAEIEDNETYTITIDGISATGTISDDTPLGPFENGILVSHEGNFGMGNASISFVSYDFATVENNIFNNVNGNALGDTAQSIAFYDNLAYVVLNGSNKIEIVNRYTFESVTTIDSGLSNPRHIAFANGKGYVTNWGDGSSATDDYLAIIDLSTNTLSAQTISVEEGPEEIVANDDMVYVAHQGGWSQNDIVSVIDTGSDTVTTTINVGDVPNTLQFDDLGDLWVLCGGNPSWTGNETAGKLSKINTSDNSVTSIDFGATEHPNFLSISDGMMYYYLGGSVYKMATSDSTLPSTSEITGLNLYNMTVKDNMLYGVDAGDFVSNGTFSSYGLSSNTMTNTTNVSIIPGGIYFN